MTLEVLSIEEQAAHKGATHKAVVTHTDLTEAVANTAQVIALATVAAYIAAECIEMRLITPFQDASDAAFNSTAITVGDGGSANRFLTSTELNVNGTEVRAKAGTGTVNQYTGADTVDVTVNSMAAKSLVDIDAGEVWIYLRLINGQTSQGVAF